MSFRCDSATHVNEHSLMSSLQWEQGFWKKEVYFFNAVRSCSHWQLQLKTGSMHCPSTQSFYLVCSFKLTKNILPLYCGRYFNIDLLIFKLKYIEGKQFKSHYLICFRLLEIYDYSLKAQFEDNKCSLFM